MVMGWVRVVGWKGSISVCISMDTRRAQDGSINKVNVKCNRINELVQDKTFN